MKHLTLAVGAITFISLALSGAAVAEMFSAKVVSVSDGDTINVAVGDRKERVILYGIDCPELDQPSGEEARSFTDQCCYKKSVSLDDKGRDSKGRTIAIVYLPDGTNLNEELVRQGLAWWSDKYAPQDARLKQFHQTAQTEHKGLWAAANPIPPWIWRNGKRDVQAKIVPSTN